MKTQFILNKVPYLADEKPIVRPAYRLREVFYHESGQVYRIKKVNYLSFNDIKGLRDVFDKMITDLEEGGAV